MPTQETGSSSIAKTSFSENSPTSTQSPTHQESMSASREISKPNVSGGRALLGGVFTALSNIATLPVNVASFILGGVAGKACGRTQQGREATTLALGLTIGLPFTLTGLGLSLIATALKNSEKPNFQDTFKDAFMNSNLLNFSSRLHEAADKELSKDMAGLMEDFNSEVSSDAENFKLNVSPGNISSEVSSDAKHILSSIGSDENPSSIGSGRGSDDTDSAKFVEESSKEPLSTGAGEKVGKPPNVEPNEKVAEPSFHESTVEKTNKDLQWEAAMDKVLEIGSVDYEFVPEAEIAERKEKLKAAMEKNLQAFQYAPASLRNDYELALLAVSKNPFMLNHVGDSMKQNDEILKIAITNVGKTIQYVPAEKQTEELIRLALRNDRSAFRYVDNSVKTAELVRSLTNEKEVVDAKGNPTKEVFPEVLGDTPTNIVLQVRAPKLFHRNNSLSG